MKVFLSAGPFPQLGPQKYGFPRWRFSPVQIYALYFYSGCQEQRCTHIREAFFNATSDFMCCRPRFGSSRSLCTYLSVLKLGEIKSILGISPLLIEIIGIFSQNFSNFIRWGVGHGMRVRLEDYGRRAMARQESP